MFRISDFEIRIFLSSAIPYTPRSHMAYDSYSAFIAALEKAGELKRISTPVATELEITELADRE